MPPQRPARSYVHLEAYPENQTWKDTGCRLRPACLSCDLPRCIHDEQPEGKPRAPRKPKPMTELPVIS